STQALCLTYYGFRASTAFRLRVQVSSPKLSGPDEIGRMMSGIGTTRPSRLGDAKAALRCRTDLARRIPGGRVAPPSDTRIGPRPTLRPPLFNQPDCFEPLSMFWKSNS